MMKIETKWKFLATKDVFGQGKSLGCLVSQLLRKPGGKL